MEAVFMDVWVELGSIRGAAGLVLRCVEREGGVYERIGVFDHAFHTGYGVFGIAYGGLADYNSIV